MPLFTIAIPTHNNTYEDIFRSFKSALEVGFDDYEIIISDTSENNDNYSLISNFIKTNSLLNATIYKNDSNWSMWDNHNFLIEQAHGKYIFFLHSDDVILQGTLSNLYRTIVLYSYPSKIIIAGTSIFKSYKNTLNELHLQSNTIISGEDLVRLFSRGGLTPSGTLFSSDIKDLGGFIGNSMVIPYSDCWSELNFALHGFRLLFCDDIFFLRDSNGTKIRYGSDKTIKEIYERIKKYFPEPLAMVVINSALSVNSWIVLKHFSFDNHYKKYIMKKALIRILLHPIKNRRLRRFFYWHGRE